MICLDAGGGHRPALSHAIFALAPLMRNGVCPRTGRIALSVLAYCLHVEWQLEWQLACGQIRFASVASMWLASGPCGWLAWVVRYVPRDGRRTSIERGHRCGKGGLLEQLLRKASRLTVLLFPLNQSPRHRFHTLIWCQAPRRMTCAKWLSALCCRRAGF